MTAWMPNIVLIGGGGGLSLWLLRRQGASPYLRAIVLTSYALRVAAALGLYAISAYHLPLLTNLQLPNGFWRLAYDAPFYHEVGIRIGEALRHGEGLPLILFGDEPFRVDNYEFFDFVGVVYWALGAHPLRVPLINAFLWTVIALLGYRLARRLNGERAGVAAATLISFWPSTFVWSSQILKDPLMLLLLLTILQLVIRIWEAPPPGVLACALGLAPAVFLLGRIRYYLVVLLIVTIVPALVVMLAVRWRALGWQGLARVILLMALLWAPYAESRSLNALYLRRVFPYTGVQGSVRPRRTVTVIPPPQAVQPSEDKASDLAELLGRLGLRPFLEVFSVASLADRRRGYLSTGGTSSFGTDVQFRSLGDVVAFLPHGLAYALFAPFPWDWPPPNGETGVFKTASVGETLLLMGVSPFLLVGAVRAARSRRIEAWILLLFGTATLVALALTVTNLGILFRLRLSALIPLFVLGSTYGLPVEPERGDAEPRRAPA